MPKHSLWQDSSVFDRDKVAKGAKVTNTFEDFAPQSKQNSQDDDFLKTTLSPKSTASNHQEPITLLTLTLLSSITFTSSSFLV